MFTSYCSDLFAPEKEVSPVWISLCNCCCRQSDIEMRSFCLLTSMELVLRPYCSLFSFVQYEKSIDKKKRIVIIY